MPETPPPFHPLTWLRNSFLAGVAVVLPFLVTAWLIWIVVSLIDQNVAPMLPPLLRDWAESIPGAGVVFAILALTLSAHWPQTWSAAGSSTFAERLIANVPFVRSIYGGAKQVFTQIAAS